jgi:hypothetical protein
VRVFFGGRGGRHHRQIALHGRTHAASEAGRIRLAALAGGIDETTDHREHIACGDIRVCLLRRIFPREDVQKQAAHRSGARQRRAQLRPAFFHVEKPRERRPRKLLPHGHANQMIERGRSARVIEGRERLLVKPRVLAFHQRDG